MNSQVRYICETSLRIAYLFIMLWSIPVWSAPEKPELIKPSVTTNLSNYEIDKFLRTVADEDLRKLFALDANCRERLSITSEVIDVTPVSDRVARVTEKWTVIGCNQKYVWRVIFNPDSGTGMSYRLWSQDKSAP
jgi:hypothetical protein